MAYELIKKLLPLIELYEANPSANDNIENFAQWLLQKSDKEQFDNNINHKREKYEELSYLYVNNSRLLVSMYRYAKSHARKAIPEDSLITFDDYGYLVILFYEGKQTKTQLIERNIHEKSTGMEIIKRLIKIGLITQENNENDKRSKWVFLTQLGIDSMEKIQFKMWELTRLVNGNLTDSEAETLYSLLKKLDDFHKPIFDGQQKAPIF